MGRLQERIWVLSSLLTFLTDPGFGYSIIQGPHNLTILAGSVARFNCTVSEGWSVLIWLHNEWPQLTVENSGKVLNQDKRYSQQNYTSGTEFTSELMIYDVQPKDSGRIACSLLGNNYEYAFLSVQVNGSLNIKNSDLTVRKNQSIAIVCEALGWAPAPRIAWMVNNISVENSRYSTSQSQGLNDLYNEESILTLTPVSNSTVTCLATIDALSKPQNATVTLVLHEPSTIESNDSWRTRTIILAVVLPIVGLLLLILIILLIICCCKKRKESNYEKEMRKVPEKKVNDRHLEIMRESGIENYGYSPEKPKNTEQMRRAPTSSPDNSSFYGSGQDLEVNPELEVPYDGHDDTVLPPRITAYPVNPRKIRNLTLV
ncbi:immunoglobulin superfamily member 5 isoform X1 [Hemicordylus capensis]|uniref:immunoglobulin superfamily member 5 isoform X1 n=1 Tax=Hemicordylus capensis TaxID=884348 RepID=UPI00230320BC|nr:immunoglobulin superfamily member 5 isoform X1 [Hemicordylus capensis]